MTRVCITHMYHLTGSQYRICHLCLLKKLHSFTSHCQCDCHASQAWCCGRLHRGCDQPEPFDCEDGCLADLADLGSIKTKQSCPSCPLVFRSFPRNLRFQPVAFAVVSGKTRVVLCPCQPGMPRRGHVACQRAMNDVNDVNDEWCQSCPCCQEKDVPVVSHVVQVPVKVPVPAPVPVYVHHIHHVHPVHVVHGSSAFSQNFRTKSSEVYDQHSCLIPHWLMNKPAPH